MHVHSDLRVGTWLVQPGLNTISQNGTTRQLEPKVMEVLLCLANHPGETLPKEQLLKALWPDTFVSDDVLVRSISELRRAFEDDTRESKFIQTIAKRGYRLVAPVVAVNVDAGLAAGKAKQTISPRRGSRIGIVIGVTATAALLVLLALTPASVWRKLAGKTDVPQIRSIAVLPLDNLSGDPAQEYFADGMTEELITDLSQISALRVASHRSVLRYKKSDKTVPEVARELNVDAVIEGSVQRTGDRVRITAQLIYAPQDKNIFAKSYERDFGDALALQATVAAAVADEIRVKMTDQERASLKPGRPVNPKALDDYLEGKYHDVITFINTLKNQPGTTSVEDEYAKAVACLERAIQEDPDFAPPYVALADTNNGDAINAETISRKKALLTKALSLDPTNLRAHQLKAKFFLVFDANWEAAGEELRRAVELRPDSAETHDWYAGYLDNLGRYEEGMKEHQRAQALDPDHDYISSSPLTPLAVRLARQRKFMLYAGADFGAHYELGNLEFEAGEYAEALREWQTEARGIGWDEGAEAWGRAFANGGPRSLAREVAKTFNEAAKHQRIASALLICVNRYAGNREEALAALESAFEQRDDLVLGLKSDYNWDPYRSDPRFKDVLRRVGLPP
jgi:TolB-like protein/DNA-binding winged helix-turn-helix (wHTH) protein